MNIDLKAFRDFCAAKPADEVYDVSHAGTCPLAQFGLPGILAHEMPNALWDALCKFDADAKTYAKARAPMNFGALTLRLEALL